MKTVLVIAKKELAETLRDPLVLAMSLGFPLLFYPLLIWGVTQISMLQQGIDEKSPPRIAVMGCEAPGPGGLVDALLSEEVIPSDGDVDDLRTDDLDLLVTVKRDGQAIQIELSHDSTRTRSTHALSWAEDKLEEVRTQRIAELAAAAGITPEDLDTWTIDVENVRQDEDKVQDVMVQVMPAMGFLALLIAVMAPTVDVFIGERERGTLETTLTAAISRRSMLIGKILAVSVIAMLASFGSLFAVGLSFIQMLAGLTQEAIPPPPIYGWDLLMLAPSMLTFAALMVALNALLILPARTVKHAQNISSIFLLVGSVALIWHIDAELNPVLWHALLPIGNVLVATSMALSGTMTMAFAAVSCALNTALTALMLLYMEHKMNDEQYLFGNPKPSLLTRWFPSKGATEGSDG